MPKNLALFWRKMVKNLALSLRKWHKKNLIGENGGERKINPSANPALDPDQDRQGVGPDLGPSCLQWLSADNKSHCKQGKS